MGVFDWILLILLIVAALWGLIRGYKSSIPRLIFIVSIVVAIYAGIPIGTSIMNSQFGQITVTNFYQSKLPDSDVFLKSINGLTIADRNILLNEAFTSLHFPKFFAGFFISKVSVVSETVKAAVASSFAYYTIVGVMFIIFFLLPCIVLNIIYKMIKKVSPFGEDGKNMLGRIAGAIQMIVFASVIYYVIMFIVVLISQITFKNGISNVNDFLIKDLKLDNTSSFSLARLFYTYSLSLLNWISLR